MYLQIFAFVRSFGRLLISFVIIIQLASCGFTSNIVKMSRSTTSTYVLNDPITDYFDPSVTSVFVRVSDLSCLNKKKYHMFIQDVKNQIAAIGYTITNSPTEADVVISVTLKDFTNFSDTTVTNIKKYVQYKGSVGILKIGANGFSGNKINIAMSDETVSIVTSGTLDIKNTSAFSKLLALDFVSGLAIGGLLGLAIFGANPWAIVVGAVAGSVATVLLEIITHTKNYGGIVDVVIEKKNTLPTTVKSKNLYISSGNSAQEIYQEEITNRISQRTHFLIITEATFSKSLGQKKFSTAASYSVANIFK